MTAGTDDVNYDEPLCCSGVEVSGAMFGKIVSVAQLYLCRSMCPDFVMTVDNVRWPVRPALSCTKASC